jgi:thymidylate synthase (FAD)
MNQVTLVQITPEAEALMARIARVSSKNPDNPNYASLLRYCAQHGHWSVFEQAHMTVDVTTSLAISVQLLRHRSFTFQQFSGRYQDQTLTGGFYLPDKARVQDPTNRQNSIVSDDEDLTSFLREELTSVYEHCLDSYRRLLDSGIAKEIARFALPEGVLTRLYVTGSIRSFIHYIQVRADGEGVQEEHREIARQIKRIFVENLPTVSEAMGWL